MFEKTRAQILIIRNIASHEWTILVFIIYNMSQMLQFFQNTL